MSQQAVYNCEFCGEPSVIEIEVQPAVYKAIEGVRTLQKRATKAWVCERHREAVEADRGWQDRQRVARKQARDDLKARTEESPLFDAGPRVEKRRSYEDAA